MKTQTLKIWAMRLGLLALPLLVLPLMTVATADEASPIVIISKVIDILNWLIIAIFIMVTIYFFWGVVAYIGAGGDEAKLKSGRDHMLWGIIGMAVMVAVWGIVQGVVNYFDIGGGGIPVEPGEL